MTRSKLPIYRIPIIFLILILPVKFSYAQKIFWSNITEQDKDEAGFVIQKFFSAIANGHFDSLNYLLKENYIYYGDNPGMEREKFIQKIRKNLSGKNPVVIHLNGFTFEDFLDSYQSNNLIRRVYPFFDNHSILVNCVYGINNQQSDVIFVLNQNSDNTWEISGISGFGSSFIPVKDEISVKLSFRIEKVNEAGVNIELPDGFSTADVKENQVNYYLKGKTDRDAVIQVMHDQLKAKIYYYIYKFVEFTNQQYKISDLRVRYLPAGILFDYIAEDPYGNKNKALTMGIDNKGEAVVIQFYCLMDTYEKIRPEIEHLFRNVRIQ